MQTIQLKFFALVILGFSFFCTPLQASQSKISAHIEESMTTVIENCKQHSSHDLDAISNELIKGIEPTLNHLGSRARLYETHSNLDHNENKFFDRINLIGLEILEVKESKDVKNPYDNIDAKKTYRNFLCISQELENKYGFMSRLKQAANVFIKSSPHNVGNNLFKKLLNYRDSLSGREKFLYGKEKEIAVIQKWDELIASAAKKMFEDGMLNIKNFSEALESFKEGFMKAFETEKMLGMHQVQISKDVAEQRLDAAVFNILLELMRKLTEGHEALLADSEIPALD